MRRRLALASFLAVTLSAAPATARVETLSSTTSRIIDRTFLCSIALPPPGYPDPGVRHGAIGVSSGPIYELPPGSAGGKSGGGSGVRDKTGSGGIEILRGAEAERAGGVWVTRSVCTWARKLRIPLTPQGLPGPPIRFNKGFECTVPRRILVRVRALARRPVNWTVSGEYLRVTSDLLESHLAVRTFPARKPLALAVIDQKGDSRLYASPRCVEDF
jgi:hypothetical protein